MNFLKYTLITLLTLALIGGAGYLYASSGIKSKPGYVELTMPERSAILALSLGPSGVSPVRWLFERVASDKNREIEVSERVLRTVLQDLQGVQLKVYEVNNDRFIFDQAIDNSMISLKSHSWQTLLQVREEEERVVVMQSGDDDLIDGLAILVSTPDNAVFVNLLGPFSPKAIAQAAENAL